MAVLVRSSNTQLFWTELSSGSMDHNFCNLTVYWAILAEFPARQCRQVHVNACQANV